MNDREQSIEERILHIMRSILINVIKDTATEPGLKHPLSPSTINKIRHGLELVTARQKEIAEEVGESWDMRPTYPPEPSLETKDGTVVPITGLKRKKPDKEKS